MATIKFISNENLLNNQAEIIEIQASLGEWIAEKYFDRWESGAPIPFSVYSGVPCVENDLFIRNGLRLSDEEIIERLCSITEGDYVVCETPSEPTTAILIVSLVLAVVSIALAPKPELPANVNRNQESPNNKLGGRNNVARPLERIPDIKGQVLSIPDIIAPTYSTYVNNQEIEHGLYCIGRKRLSISSVKDGETPISLIDGSSAGIYYPGNNPNTVDPDVSIGSHVSEPIVTAYRSNEANGITLSPDFDSSLIDATTINFESPYLGNSSRFRAGVPDEDIFISYNLGDLVELQNVIVDGVDISGQFTIIEKIIQPFGAALLVFDYGSPLSPFSGNASSGTMFRADVTEFAGYFYLTGDKFDSCIVNIIAPNGLYKDKGEDSLEAVSIDFQIVTEEVDSNGLPSGTEETRNGVIFGASQQLRAITVNIDFENTRYFRIKVKRLTPRSTEDAVIVDEIKLEDIYGIKNETSIDLGDVTIIQTITKATQFATAIKERRLNCIATEMLYQYQGNGVFSGALTENKRAVQSFITDAIDPVIGNRSLSEIDADGLLSLDSEINAYFGNIFNGEFSYTFDSTDITFQDYTQTIFNAINCVAYREGSVIKAFFEKLQINPAMLFTHRSKKPGSEKYTREFNQQRLNDGVEFNWVNPDTNTTDTIYIPSDRSAVNPKQFNIAGIRNEKQANIRALREYNKLLYQKQSCELTVTAEGRYVNIGEKINIVKGSRVNTQDGEVLAVDNTGLILTLSQDVVFEVGESYSVWIKNDDGTTENITCTAGTESNEIVLDFLPTQPIRTGLDKRRTEFSFGNEARHDAQSWLPQEVDISDKLYVGLNCINYTDNYYKDDSESFRAFSKGFSKGFG